ncbi:hypothetical protein [Salarchaeum sp. JOR-1]|uniref:hypothetical protein n=1 Tax=Salarchaeum sp. JOR-1 TaxID=2599399 RepID=UPI001198B262|nr:hypothetical protein [Salarchaeum sp. JOR-1]QDX40116.1 hypothetical protein FQU85_04125 [Salarchaeum sp. JOR-1]
MEPSPREQVFRASAVMVGVAAALFALSYVLEPSTAFAAVLGVAAAGVFAGVVLDALDDRFGLVWLSFGLAAAVVYLSADAGALRESVLGLVGVAIAGALLWFVPAKATELGERLHD